MLKVAGKSARVVVTGIVGLAMVLAMAGCGGGNGDDRTADVIVPDEDTFRYEPDRLELSLNQETSFTFLNRDDIVHNVTIPALSNDVEQNPIDMDMQPGERISVPIPAVTEVPRDGFFLFYCKYHQTQGMSGRITVSS